MGGVDLRTAVGELADARRIRRGSRMESGTGKATRRRTFGDVAGRGGEPVALPPTPSAANPNENIEAWSERRERVKESAGNGNGFGMPLGMAVRMLPTTTVSDANASGGNPETTGSHGTTLTDAVVRDESVRVQWGDYEPAIRRWEHLTRPAPAPTNADGKNGNHRLSARFTEWMMGYPDGWITDIIPRNPAIKACGNGVVPQQAYEALYRAWPALTGEAVSA